MQEKIEHLIIHPRKIEDGLGDFRSIIKIKANFAACQGIKSWLDV